MTIGYIIPVTTQLVVLSISVDNHRISDCNIVFFFPCEPIASHEEKSAGYL